MEPIYAAIDVGANALKLKIVEYISGKRMILEDISKTSNIGSDVYELGYIEHQTVKEVIDVMSYFSKVLNMYHVSHFRAIGTSSLREATNAQMVVEMIMMKTQIKVEIVEDSIEKFLTYKSMRDYIPDYRSIRRSALVVEINSGSSDVSMYHRNHLIKNEEIRIGTKNLKHLILDMEDRSVTYPATLEELLETRTSHMWREIKQKKLEHFLCLGGEAKTLKSKIFDNQSMVSREHFKAIYKGIFKEQRQLRSKIEAMDLDWYEFVVSMLIYNMFFDLTQAKHLFIPDISLRDGIIADLIEKEYGLKRYHAFNNDIYALVKQISKRYQSSDAHLKQIEKYALMIFEALCSHYQFNERDEMLLRLSAMLHEIGKYTRLKDYLITSYDKIINMSILGVSQEEVYMIAHICRLISSSEVKKYEAFLDGVDEKHYSRVFKLAAIMSIADALDKGKKQKIQIEQINVSDDLMTILFHYKGDITLEELSFDFAKENFVKTFGILPLLNELEG